MWRGYRFVGKLTLQLSDDSDIEEHPNVDKKSMIRYVRLILLPREGFGSKANGSFRWKQRDIHEKREARKMKIAKLQSELTLNSVLRPRIASVLTGLNDKGINYFRSVQRRIRESPSSEKPETGAPNQPTYDMMLGQLLGDVWRESTVMMEGGKFENGMVTVNGKKIDEKTEAPAWAEGEIPEGKVQKLQEVLGGRLQWHLNELDKRDGDVKKEIEEEEKEMGRKITSDDIKDGWDVSSVAPKKEDPLAERPKKKKVEEIEVLNPGASVSLILSAS
jgi:cell division cycle protein 37